MQDDGGQANSGIDTDQQPRKITFEIVAAIADLDKDGFVDGSNETAYQIFYKNSGITLTSKANSTYNDRSISGKFDLIAAVGDGQNFFVCPNSSR